MQKVEKPDKEEAYIFKEKLEPLMPGAKKCFRNRAFKDSATKILSGNLPCESDEGRK